jgi:hypothetical protein
MGRVWMSALEPLRRLYNDGVKDLLKRPGFLAVLFALAFCAQVIPRWWSDSIVLDEEWEITAGYEYWKTGDVWSAFGSTASGSLPALPLLTLNLQRDSFLSDFQLPDRSILFLFVKNPDSLTRLTVLARSVTLLLCLLTLFLLYRCVRQAPWPEKTAALALWAFDPTWLALGGTAKSDCAGAWWMFLLVFVFRRVQGKPSTFGYAAVGLLCAAATTARHTNFSAPLVLIALEAAYGLSRSPEAGKKPVLRNLLSRWGALTAGYALWISLVFLPGAIFDPAHLSPFHYYARYLRHFGGALDFVQQSSYFMAGSNSGGNSFFYAPFHLFFKSTLPFLLLVGLAIALVFRRAIRLEPWIWIPPVVHLSLAWAANPHMLPRHVLPVSPFLILAAARAFQWFWKNTRHSVSPWVRALPAVLLAWHALGVAAQWPRHHSYANECAPQRLKTRLLNKFSWQLDQDVKRLAETGQRKGWTRVSLVSTGRIDPFFYGLSWEPWTLDDFRRPSGGRVYVVDAALFQLTPDQSNGFDWRKSWLARVPPTGRVVDTWFTYEFPNSPRRAKASAYLPSFLFLQNGYPIYRRGFAPGALEDGDKSKSFRRY